MARRFDPRIVSAEALRFLRAAHARVPFHLGGGAALSGYHLHHRLSSDADLFFHSRQDLRDLVSLLPDVGAESQTRPELVRDAGTFVRARFGQPGPEIEIDMVFDAVPDL